MKYYFNTATNETISETLLRASGFPVEEGKLRMLGIFPVEYEYIEFNSDTHKMLPDGLPTLNADRNVYVQKFKAVKLDTNGKEAVLEHRREQKLQQLHDAWLNAEADGVITSSVGFDIDATERANRDLEGLIVSMEASNTSNVTFCGADNSFHEVTLEQLKTMRLEVIAHGQSLYAKKWELREAINSAKTLAALNAINISFEGV